MKRIVPALCAMSVCGLAHAEIFHWSEISSLDEETTSRLGRFTIDVSGMQSWGFQGDPANQILDVFVGAGASIPYISWDVNLTTVGLSWADESTMTFNGVEAVIPGFGDAFTVTNANYIGGQNSGLVLDGSGILSIEFHEVGFDDNPGAVDSFYEAGSYIYIGIPSPGALGVFGISGLIGVRRRRGR